MCLLTLAAGGGGVVAFVDIAESLGMTTPVTFGGRQSNEYLIETTGTGTAIADFDGDGWNDVFIANGTTLSPANPTPSLFYRNTGKGHFEESGAKAGFTYSGWAQGVCAADYDNDGRLDLAVTYYGHNLLYRNLGQAKFEDVTARAGLPVTGTRWGAGCTFFDYDKDGSLDLFVANYVDLDLKTAPKPGEGTYCQWKGIDIACGPRGLPTARNVLYRNNGDGTFSDVSEKAGILKPGGRYGLGVVSADFDNDGWPDLYVACDMTPSILYRNKGDGTFEEKAAEAGVAYNFDGRLQSGMGAAVVDADGNGFLDIVKTNFSGDRLSLYLNEDGHFFTDAAQQAGMAITPYVGWGVAFLDVDEDGLPDVLAGNGHIDPRIDQSTLPERYRQRTMLYRNLGGGRFQDITAEAGPALQMDRAARGLATGDLDGDGRPEVVISNINEPPTVLCNSLKRTHRAIRIRLRGVKSNRSAIGARVTVTAGGRRQMREMQSGGSYYSQSEFALYFGLGTADQAAVEIAWPSGGKRTWKDLAAERDYLFVEGQAEPEVSPLDHRRPDGN